MLRLACTLHFADGQSVTGTIRAASPHSDCPVRYDGEVSRLIDPPMDTMPALLRAWFEAAATSGNAGLSIQQEGQYDWWAE